MFIIGLDHTLDQVSSRFLAMSPLPTLEETYSLVRREVQRQLTIGIEDCFEGLAFVVPSNLRLASPTGSSIHCCTHCTTHGWYFILVGKSIIT